ncbi:hypothetical protein KAR52_02515 [Candidatus Pacearchaeota archaeon]|nr:hypothetical protein [Candidatus Pacearchaeota archaeon]
MSVQNALDTKTKILSIIQRRGPSLPVHITKEIGLNMLFTSAFLSELASEKKIIISNMKVGNSPVYFIHRQEPMLERFAQYLNSKEKEAFFLLKEKKFLKDRIQDPAIRVALREIKDFAISFKKNEEIFWRFFTIPESEFEVKEPEKKIFPIPKQDNPEIKQETKELEIFDKPLKKIPPEIKSKSKKKEKSEFVINLLNFVKENNIELLEEIEFKKREFSGIAQINTSLGLTKILIIGKDKKKITENDLQIAIQKCHANKKIVLLLSSGELDKKAVKFLEEYKDILKFLKIK